VMFGVALGGDPNCKKYLTKNGCNQRRQTHACIWQASKCRYDPNWVAPVDDGNVNIQDCKDNYINCPRYPPGVFAEEYPTRFKTGPGENQCIVASQAPILDECKDICVELFETYTEETTWGVKVSQACQIGCGFAEQAMSDPSAETCMKHCKNTVWHRQTNTAQCNWDQGMDLAVFEMQEFGSGKACELGCIIVMNDHVLHTTVLSKRRIYMCMYSGALCDGIFSIL